MLLIFFFFFNDTATTEISTRPYTLSLHDALPISAPGTREAVPVPAPGRRRGVPHHPRPLRSDRRVRWSGPRRVQRPTPRLREVVVDPGREAAPDGRHGDARFVPP